MKLIAANWKMNPATLEEARKLAAEVERAVTGLIYGQVEVVICAPFIYLPALKHTVHHVRLGAQNVSAEETGPFTGEISALQLKNLGIGYVLVGHSERRTLGEDNRVINNKLKQCEANGLHPILCVGYGTMKSMSDTRVKNIIATQLRAALAGTRFAKGGLTIAYEPMWAISKGPGTAVPVAPDHAAEIIEFIKKKYLSARVIYGGSTTAKNAPELAERKVIEGGLPGGASLKAEEFLSIIKAFI